MDMSFEERLIAYRLAISLAAGVLRRWIISSRDYERIDVILAEKYGFSSIIIYPLIDWIKHRFRANMAPTKGR